MRRWRTFSGRTIQLALVWVAQLLAPPPAAAADGGLDLLSAETLTVTGDLRLRATDGERSWVDGEFGKLRYGGGDSGEPQARPEVVEAALVWQPRITWSLKGTVVAIAEGGPLAQAGLSEAFLSFKPLSDNRVKFSARAGLMWPPISLEHSGPEWAVTDTITPSAIHSWVGEEVKVLGLEATGRIALGEHTVSATIAGFDLNDTAGTLLAFRGWAMHDRKALAFRKQPLPPLAGVLDGKHPDFSHPVIDIDGGFLRRPGYYAKAVWQSPEETQLEVLHYDNNANPAATNSDVEYGWRTKFSVIGLTARSVPGWVLRAQALSGRTRMGAKTGGLFVVDTKFRSMFAMLTRQYARGSATVRLDLFGTRNRGSVVRRADDEDGWAATIAAKRNLGRNLAVLAEFLRIESTKHARDRLGHLARQSQNQLQVALRVRL